LVPYAPLPESEKEYNCAMALAVLKATLALGYPIERAREARAPCGAGARHLVPAPAMGQWGKGDIANYRRKLCSVGRFEIPYERPHSCHKSSKAILLPRGEFRP
jgi:hypothetical protein